MKIRTMTLKMRMNQMMSMMKKSNGILKMKLQKTKNDTEVNTDDLVDNNIKTYKANELD